MQLSSLMKRRQLDPDSTSLFHPIDDDGLRTRILAELTHHVAIRHSKGFAHGCVDAQYAVVENGHCVSLRQPDDTVPLTSTTGLMDLVAIATLGLALIPVVDPIRDRIRAPGATARRPKLRQTYRTLLAEAAAGKLTAPRLEDHLRQSLWFDDVAQSPLRSQHSADRESPCRNVAARKQRHLLKRRSPLAKRRSAVTFRAPVRTVLLTVALLSVATAAGSRVERIASTTPTDSNMGQRSCFLRPAASIDIDNDGCLDAVTINGGVVTVNNETFTVGQPDDRIVLGDWRCTNTKTIAVLRPSTSQVFVFDSWPASGANTSPRLSGTYPGAETVESRAAGTCDELLVRGTAGTVTLTRP